ncbi:unnamed protein product [Parascedosporium putredinis]|uniref:Uncharacterized protein n=1 Tax=Parascedosporium putredinis TaxID=1442378 RepID=A0A9P1MA68_9PEZI|nr:unnamed protein product [Parascedosporium putredinis]CAI7993399.1 unnamed protein product [Parascedosporium putredinis]
MHLVNASAALLALAWSAHAQNIFINQVPEYSALPACAEAPLSQISSTRFVNAISTAVASKCPTDRAAAQSALEVFDDYCHLTQGSAPTRGVNGSSAPTSDVTPAKATPETTVGLSTDRTLEILPHNDVDSGLNLSTYYKSFIPASLTLPTPSYIETAAAATNQRSLASLSFTVENCSSPLCKVIGTGKLWRRSGGP